MQASVTRSSAGWDVKVDDYTDDFADDDDRQVDGGNVSSHG